MISGHFDRDNHSSIQTTLIYLELVPDPTGSRAFVIVLTGDTATLSDANATIGDLYTSGQPPPAWHGPPEVAQMPCLHQAVGAHCRLQTP